MSLDSVWIMVFSLEISMSSLFPFLFSQCKKCLYYLAYRLQHCIVHSKPACAPLALGCSLSPLWSHEEMNQKLNWIWSGEPNFQPSLARGQPTTHSDMLADFRPLSGSPSPVWCGLSWPRWHSPLARNTLTMLLQGKYISGSEVACAVSPCWEEIAWSHGFSLCSYPWLLWVMGVLWRLHARLPLEPTRDFHLTSLISCDVIPSLSSAT